VDEDALTVAVRVADDDLRRADGTDAGDSRRHLAGHPLARTLIFEAVRTKLGGLDDARDPFHVDGNEDLPGPGLRQGPGETNDQQKQNDRGEPFHERLILQSSRPFPAPCRPFLPVQPLPPLLSLAFQEGLFPLDSPTVAARLTASRHDPVAWNGQ